jgi:hypothetical protein
MDKEKYLEAVELWFKDNGGYSNNPWWRSLILDRTWERIVKKGITDVSQVADEIDWVILIAEENAT